jgi:endogenous inhibitor of DNA gyrase (YacG/DUF329 family)
VEHSCPQCGTTVEDGRPFCPQCRAPQINVLVAAPQAGIATVASHESDRNSPETAESGNFDRPARSANTIDSGAAVRAALKAGALGLFIGAIPIIGIPLTGALAVFFYRRRSGSIVPAALGAQLGGAAGFFVFAIGALLVIAVVGLHAQQQCVDTMITTFQKLGADTSDPNFQDRIRDVFTPSGQALAFFITIVPASIGGTLASLFFRPRNPRG